MSLNKYKQDLLAIDQATAPYRSGLLAIKGQRAITILKGFAIRSLAKVAPHGYYLNYPISITKIHEGWFTDKFKSAAGLYLDSKMNGKATNLTSTKAIVKERQKSNLVRETMYLRNMR